MLKHLKWTIVLSGILFTATGVRADSAYLDKQVSQDLFFSYVNSSNPDRFEKAFASMKPAVESSPSNPALSTSEQAQLKVSADILWNREYELRLMQSVQKALPSAKTPAAMSKLILELGLLPTDKNELLALAQASNQAGLQKKLQSLINFQSNTLLPRAVKNYNAKIDLINAHRSIASAQQLAKEPAPSVQQCLNMGGDSSAALKQLFSTYVAPVVNQAVDNSAPAPMQPEKLLAASPSAAAAPLTANSALIAVSGSPSSAAAPAAATPGSAPAADPAPAIDTSIHMGDSSIPQLPAPTAPQVSLAPQIQGAGPAPVINNNLHMSDSAIPQLPAPAAPQISVAPAPAAPVAANAGILGVSGASAAAPQMQAPKIQSAGPAPVINNNLHMGDNSIPQFPAPAAPQVTLAPQIQGAGPAPVLNTNLHMGNNAIPQLPAPAAPQVSIAPAPAAPQTQAPKIQGAGPAPVLNTNLHMGDNSIPQLPAPAAPQVSVAPAPAAPQMQAPKIQSVGPAPVINTDLHMGNNALPLLPAPAAPQVSLAPQIQGAGPAPVINTSLHMGDNSIPQLPAPVAPQVTLAPQIHGAGPAPVINTNLHMGNNALPLLPAPAAPHVTVAPAAAAQTQAPKIQDAGPAPVLNTNIQMGQGAMPQLPAPAAPHVTQADPNMGASVVHSASNSQPSGPSPASVAPASAPAVSSVDASGKVSIPGDGKYDSDYVMSTSKDPSNPNLVYGISGSTDTRYMLRSTDGGKTWARAGLIPSSDYDQNTDLLYNHITVGAGGKELFYMSSKGTFHSTDGGKTFSPFDPSSAPGLAGSGAVISADGSHLTVSYGSVMAADKGSAVVLYNKDSSGNWQKSAVQPSDPGPVQITTVQPDPKNPQVVYAGTGHDVMRWDPQNGWKTLSGASHDSTVYNIDISPTTGEMLVSTCNGDYKGSTTSDSLSKINSPAFVKEDGVLRSYGVARQGDSNELATVSSRGVYVSNDDGKTWSPVSGLPQQTGSNEFRNVLWLPDGSLQVSGPGVGTYEVKPSSN
jgi:photosystem II stability/assembly factor-like uncharacterized protein